MATRAIAALCLITVIFGVASCVPDLRRLKLQKVEATVGKFSRKCGRLPHSLDELVGVVSRVDKCANVQFLKPVETRINGIPVHYWKNDADGSFQLRWPGQDGVFGSADDVTVKPENRVWGGTSIVQRWWLQALALGVGLLSLCWLRRWWPRHRAAEP